MSDLKAFEQFIKDQIPLAEQLSFSLLEYDQKSLSLKAPFAPNKNDKNTMFAGSQASLALLAGWALVTLRFKEYGVQSVAAVKTEMSYLKPIEGEVSLRSKFSKDLSETLDRLDNKGRARAYVKVELVDQKDGKTKAEFSAEYYLSK